MSSEAIIWFCFGVRRCLTILSASGFLSIPPCYRYGVPAAVGLLLSLRLFFCCQGQCVLFEALEQLETGQLIFPLVIVRYGFLFVMLFVMITVFNFRKLVFPADFVIRTFWSSFVSVISYRICNLVWNFVSILETYVAIESVVDLRP